MGLCTTLYHSLKDTRSREAQHGSQLTVQQAPYKLTHSRYLCFHHFQWQIRVPETIFYQTLERFKIGLNDHEKEDFGLTTLDEVNDIICEIQDEHASERKMQNMTRIQTFLEGMEQYGNVIEVFLNASVFVAFVWVAKTCTDSLDSLLNTYEQICETIPQLLQYDKLFKQNPAMQRVLGLIYKDILEFHRRALVVFKRRSWRRHFSATWKDFNTHFGRLLDNLRRHKRDIESQASLVEIERNQSLREDQEKQFLAAESKERERQEKVISENWSKEPDFGRWLLNHEKVKAWFDSGNADAGVLWLKGIPGAGKSVLASRLIAEARDLKSPIFFYCKHEDRSRSSLAAALKGFLAQLIRLNSEVISHIYEECFRSSELTLETLDFL
ncbi:uncharacterized protein PAC_01141 [Phialocephala subalpina]|uniref:NACHT domain-containing protein n=1 Tax=Phialocephala subalpina TaxID=576137 RepID=A0A1L7WES9_9HELO|nr:uncharacterized protein PAC_01141 [Phialocephala subalpina]